MNATLHLNKNGKGDTVPTICVASYDDVEKMVIYGEQFWHQTRYFERGVTYDFESVMAMTNHLIDEGIVLYAEADDEVVALMLIVVSPLPMNNDHLTAAEWVFYIDKKYRGSRLGVKLMKKAEEMLTKKRVQFFTMISMTNVTPDAANRLYEHLGFEHLESCFTKELSWH